MGLEQSERGGARLEVRAGMAGRGRGQVLQGCADREEDLGFYPEEDGSPRGLQAEEGPDSGDHRHPLVAASGKTDCGAPR